MIVFVERFSFIIESIVKIVVIFKYVEKKILLLIFTKYLDFNGVQNPIEITSDLCVDTWDTFCTAEPRSETDDPDLFPKGRTGLGLIFHHQGRARVSDATVSAFFST
jgi:hypothetical protein